MLRPSFRIILSFAILGVGFCAGCHSYDVPNMEEPPCKSCSSIYQSAPGEIQTISFCDLLKTPERYDGQVIRYVGVLKHESGHFSTSRKECGNDAVIDVQLDPSLKACVGAGDYLFDEMGSRHQCIKHPFGFNGDAYAQIIARFERHSGRHSLVALCIERVPGPVLTFRISLPQAQPSPSSQPR
jgi:hypothetical protein